MQDKHGYQFVRCEDRTQTKAESNEPTTGFSRQWIWTLAAIALFASVPAWAQTITAVRSSLKVRPGDRPAVVSSIEIHAARNEFEAFQLVISSSSSLSSVTVDPPTLTLANSTTTIPASEVRLYREAYASVNQASNPEGAYYAPGSGSRIPDALIPMREDGAALSLNSTNGTWSEVNSSGETRNAFPVSVAANDNLVVWVDVHVPPGQTAGQYSGVVTVRNNNVAIGTMNVVLKVLNFDMPSTSTLRVAFGFSVDGVCVAHGDGSSFCNNTNGLDAFHRWAKLYGRFLLDHRISIDLADGVNSQPTTASMTSYNADYGPIINGTDSLQRLAGAQMTTIKYPWFHTCSNSTYHKPAGCEDQPTFTNKLQQWINFTKNTSGTFGGRTFNWFDRTFHFAIPDEPNGGATGQSCITWADPMQINNQATWANQLEPNFKVMVTANIGEYNNCGANSPVSIIDPVLDSMQDTNSTATTGNHRNDYSAFLQPSGHELWMYQSCDQSGCSQTNNWPNLALDATGVQARAEPWMHYIYDTKGMLYFDSVKGIGSAWSPNGLWDSGTHMNADGLLVYAGTPGQIGGTTHIPVASYRLNMLREGLEDYEYLVKCAQITTPANALSIAQSLFPAPSMRNANNYPNQDPAGFADRLETARGQLESCILGTGAPPHTTTVAPSGTGSGTVVSSPAGINCGTSCSASFPDGTAITLTATPNSGSSFGGFSGGCVSSTTTCTFTPTADSTVNAVFNSGPPPCNFTDCFNRADSATLGTNWNTVTPSIEIFSNQARASSTGSKAAAYVTNVGPDQDISVDCQVAAAGSNCGLMARFNDANNFYYAYLDGGQGKVTIQRNVGGTTTLVGTATRTIAFNTYYRLRLVVQGSTLSLYFNNESTPAVTATDTYILTGNFGGLHAFAGAVSSVLWDNFNIQAATPTTLFSDDFNRTTGLGANWSVETGGSYTTDGANAVSGPNTPSGHGNWASVVPALNTNDYAVVANFSVPAGSLDSGIVARGSTSGFSSDLYAAQISTSGAVNLFRRNAGTWTQLGTFATTIQANVFYNLKLLVSGSTTVHLEVWFNGTRVISFDDGSANAIKTGVPGIENYDPNIKYDAFAVYPPS